MDLVKLARWVDTFYKLAIELSNYTSVREELTEDQQHFFDHLNGFFQSFVASDDSDYKQLRGGQLLSAIDEAYNEVFSVSAKRYLNEMRDHVESELQEIGDTTRERLEESAHQGAQWRDMARIDAPAYRAQIHEALNDVIRKREARGLESNPPEDLNQKVNELERYLDQFPADEKLKKIKQLTTAAKFKDSKNNPFPEWSTLDLAWALNVANQMGLLEAEKTTKMKAKTHNIDPADLEKLMMR